jgi:hypothetical protein
LPLIFLLFFELLSILIKEENEDGNVKGVNFGSNYHVTHLLFIYDILIFYKILRKMIEKLKGLIDIICLSTCMKINLSKSSISLSGINELVKFFIMQMFPCNLVDHDEGLKYLGFQLKPNLLLEMVDS